jgi:hypothetical protein
MGDAGGDIWLTVTAGYQPGTEQTLQGQNVPASILRQASKPELPGGGGQMDVFLSV